MSNLITILIAFLALLSCSTQIQQNVPAAPMKK